jgi:ABC-2 type transport system ATP-binding protein
VSQICQRVVIINKGKVVAIDTPENLTGRLQGAQSLYVQVDADSNADVGAALDAVPGVSAVHVADQRNTVTGFEVECLRDRDIRRDLARAVVSNGWGLLELRPLRMSLEEIFLQLTTQENAASATGAPGAPPTPDTGAATESATATGKETA